ncbi:DUF418 domain-containing protein [Nocardiopsis sediminis]|uniref:DUF418 domain-containing protein n=1 Tax=Nocardiopsis sediminis TaxID=1778267 RepID=A0ABV8FNY3_9ACTN
MSHSIDPSPGTAGDAPRAAPTPPLPRTSPSPARGSRRGPRTGDRLTGLDLARGLAVLGMFVIHVGLGWSGADGANVLTPLVAGRAAALFALLAGVSIALISGGSTPRTGADMGVALWRVVVRGLLMLPLGTALTMLGAPVAVILAYYAVFFVLAVPLLQERWKIVAGTTAVLAVAGPLASFWLRGLIAGGPLRAAAAAVDAYDPLVALGADGLLDLLLTGAYPAFTWLPFVLAGLAIGRLDLRAARVRWCLVGVGAALAAGAHGVSWVVLGPLGGRERLAGAFAGAPMEDYGGAPDLDAALAGGLPGTVPVNDPVWLLVTAPHSGTPLEVLGAGGIAIAVLGVCLLAGRALRWVLYPVVAVGALSLTTYVGHVLVIWAADSGLLEGGVLSFVATDLALSVVGGALAGATLWRLTGRRGPLEALVHAVSLAVARRIP